MFSGFSRVVPGLSRVGARRSAGGWLKKNLYYEENAGLRENSYKTWDPTQNNSGWKILGFLVIPFTVVYYFVVAENESKNKLMGRKIHYGVLPPPSAGLNDKGGH